MNRYIVASCLFVSLSLAPGTALASVTLESAPTLVPEEIELVVADEHAESKIELALVGNGRESTANAQKLNPITDNRGQYGPERLISVRSTQRKKQVAEVRNTLRPGIQTRIRELEREVSDLDLHQYEAVRDISAMRARIQALRAGLIPASRSKE